MFGTSLLTFPSIIMRLPSLPEETLPGSSLITSLSLSSCKWTYRGEGNANLVLALCSEREIIRLRKCPMNETLEETTDLICRDAEFCHAIMLPLLGNSYVHVPKVVKIPGRELHLLNEQLRHLRPVHRHHKSVFGSIAAVFPDFCFPLIPTESISPTFCVEIKPKQGWIPFADRRLTKCTFCLNQFWKLKNNSISERSGYCPLDLFSGDVNRMRLAIRALVQSPQNNFKMFCDGKLEYGEETSSFRPVLEKWFGVLGSDEALLQNLCNLIIQALLADYGNLSVLQAQRSLKVSSNYCRIPQNLLDKARSLLKESTCFRPSSHLPSGCILSRILRVQALDVLGSDEVYRRYSSANCGDFDYVSELIREKNVFHPLYSYLLATTAKDCSIMISFQQTQRGLVCGSKIAEDISGRNYLFSIGVSDLDPKPISCIERHKKRDVEVVKACIEILEHGHGTLVSKNS